jgi:hypothetical protein
MPLDWIEIHPETPALSVAQTILERWQAAGDIPASRPA